MGNFKEFVELDEGFLKNAMATAVTSAALMGAGCSKGNPHPKPATQASLGREVTITGNKFTVVGTASLARGRTVAHELARRDATRKLVAASGVQNVYLHARDAKVEGNTLIMTYEGEFGRDELATDEPDTDEPIRKTATSPDAKRFLP